MSDACDIGADREAEIRSDALARIARQPHMEPVGFCYNCDEMLIEKNPLNPFSLSWGDEASEKGYFQSLGCFCDTDCRDDYEKRQKLRGGYVSN